MGGELGQPARPGAGLAHAPDVRALPRGRPPALSLLAAAAQALYGRSAVRARDRDPGGVPRQARHAAPGTLPLEDHRVGGRPPGGGQRQPRHAARLRSDGVRGAGPAPARDCGGQSHDPPRGRQRAQRQRPYPDGLERHHRAHGAARHGAGVDRRCAGLSGSGEAVRARAHHGRQHDRAGGAEAAEGQRAGGRGRDHRGEADGGGSDPPHGRRRRALGRVSSGAASPFGEPGQRRKRGGFVRHARIRGRGNAVHHQRAEDLPARHARLRDLSAHGIPAGRCRGVAPHSAHHQELRPEPRALPLVVPAGCRVHGGRRTGRLHGARGAPVGRGEYARTARLARARRPRGCCANTAIIRRS